MRRSGRPCALLCGALWWGLAMGGAMAQDGVGTGAGDTQTDPAVVAMNAERARVEAETALKEARAKLRATDAAEQTAAAGQAKALADAQSQAMAARYVGDVKAGPYSGAVSVKEGAGEQEGKVLAAWAVQEAGQTIAGEVRGLRRTVWVVAAKDFPKFEVLESFELRKDILRRELTAAASVSAPAGGGGIAKSNFLPPIAAASLGLDAVDKLLGFFKTDYEMGGLSATVDEAVLLYAVAGALGQDSATEVLAPTIYAPDRGAAAKDLVAEFEELYDLRAKAESRMHELEAAEGAANADRAKEIAATLATFDGTMNALTAADATGVAPVSRLLAEYALRKKLSAGNGAVLLLRLESSSSGYVIKKNLFSGLKGIPMYVSGGAVASYLLLAGEDGRVLRGGTVPVHGGMVRVDQLQKGLRVPTPPKPKKDKGDDAAGESAATSRK